MGATSRKETSPGCTDRDGARETGPALEAWYRFLLWLVPTPERFPRCQSSSSATAFSAPPWIASNPSSMRRIPESGKPHLERLRTVSTATLTMVLIKQGVRTSWLRGPVPRDPIEHRIAGPAFTIRFVPGREDLSGPESYARSPSFRDAIEAAPAGSVVVIDGCGNPAGATLDDILVARLARKGVVAAVTDAPVRDADEVRAVGLPVLSAGVAAPPSIIGLAYAGFGEIIGCGGVAVRPTSWSATTTVPSWSPSRWPRRWRRRGWSRNASSGSCSSGSRRGQASWGSTRRTTMLWRPIGSGSIQASRAADRDPSRRRRLHAPPIN